MTLKQKLYLKQLPKNNYNISKSALQAGYSPSSARAGTLYRQLRKVTRENVDFFSKEAIERDIAKTRKLAEKKEDITNLNRIDEHRAKLGGHITEKKENINPEKLIIIDHTTTSPTREQDSDESKLT
jgi:hypothetical protein